MIEAIEKELARRFEAVPANQHSFDFWLALNDYIEFVRNTAMLKAIIDKDEASYYEAFDVIQKAWKHNQELFRVDRSLETKKQREIYKKIEITHSSEVSKLETMSVYCRFIDFETLAHAMNEIATKHELYSRGYASRHEEHNKEYWNAGGSDDHLEWLYSLTTDGAVTLEQPLNEIRVGRIGKDNRLISAVPRYFASLRFIHRVLLNTLCEERIVAKDSTAVSVGEPSAESESVVPYVSFDREASILSISGKKIRINRRDADNNQHKVLCHIFKDPAEEHFYSEIASEEFGNGMAYKQRKTMWKTYYRACQEINARVLQEVGEAGMLVFNTGTTGKVRINQKFALR